MREGSLVVLSAHKPPPGATRDWLARGGVGRLSPEGPEEEPEDDPRAKSTKRHKAETARATDAEMIDGEDRARDGLGTKRMESGRGHVVAGLLHHCRTVKDTTEDGAATESTLLEVSVHPGCGNEVACGRTCTAVLEALSARPGEPGSRWWLAQVGALTPQARELEAVASVERMPLKGLLLRPQQLKYFSDGQWPEGFHSEAFHRHLQSKFNVSQLKAVEQSLWPLASMDRRVKASPVTLVQGPPGTGKTHTIMGILNAWHLLQYQRHYSTLEDCILRKLSGAQTNDLDLTGVNEILEVNDGGIHPLPKILVCAPSNSAVDELLRRVLRDSFVDLKGTKYGPRMVRVGAADSRKISEQSKAVFVDAIIDDYMSFSPERVDEEFSKLTNFLTSLSKSVAQLSYQVAATNGASRKAAAGQLARELHRKEKYLLRLEMLECVRVVEGRPNDTRSARESLEILLMKEAEIVFTTLSSSGRNIFSRLHMPFRSVLVDEACQATEPATLQPLIHGCEHCVLVGDPQQLPATVLATELSGTNFSRSLFERLMAAGARVRVLNVQYRMHPMIRHFPSAYFYDGQLVDGPNVKSRTEDVLTGDGCLGPLRFFDVAGGGEARTSSGSLTNESEAKKCVTLARELVNAAKGRPYTIAIITPYRAQVALVKRRIQESGVRGAAGPVLVDTVDSFQGREADVVIFSCVRSAMGPGGIGFLADVRRLNVAITRPRRALWVVGRAASLRASPVWREFIASCEDRHCFVAKSSAERWLKH